MFCQKCGKELPNDSAFCPYCGAHTNISSGNSSFGYYANKINEESRKYNVWAIVGFAVAVFSFFLPGIFTLVTGISAVVISIYALNQIKFTREKGNVFAILGIVFGSAFILYTIFCILVIVGLLGSYGMISSFADFL